MKVVDVVVCGAEGGGAVRSVRLAGRSEDVSDARLHFLLKGSG